MYSSKEKYTCTHPSCSLVSVTSVDDSGWPPVSYKGDDQLFVFPKTNKTSLLFIGGILCLIDAMRWIVFVFYAWRK